MRLTDQHPVFIGCKLDTPMKRQLDALPPAEGRYVSRGDDVTFLTVCRFGEDEYVGKVITDRLTTDRVEDVRRNVLSILRRVLPDTRLPEKLEILTCEPDAPPVEGS